MNLKELKLSIDTTIKHLHRKSPEEVPVLITLAESSIGPRASSAIKYVGLGVDYERNQLRIQPNQPLVTKGNSLLDVKGVMSKRYEGRTHYVCPSCQTKIAKNDSYCRYCGQRLK